MSAAARTPRMIPGATEEAGLVLRFLDPPPGLLALTDFVLSPVDGAPELFTLRSAEPPETRLFLIDPGPFFPDYRPVVDLDILARLAPDDAALAIFAVVNPGDGRCPPTANLLAPVLVNAARGVALQVVLEDDWPLRAPLASA